MRETDDIQPTGNDRVVMVWFAGGKRARIRRDLLEVLPGRVFLPEWLDRKIFCDGGASR